MKKIYYIIKYHFLQINFQYFYLTFDKNSYIEIFYNRKRLHSSNNYMSPSDYQEKMLRLEMVG